MKALTQFIRESLINEKLTKNVKEGDTLLNTSNGEVSCHNRNNLKFLNVTEIEKDYKLIDKECKFLTFIPSNNGFDEVNRKLACIILSEVKYFKDLKKMEQEVLTVAQRYSNIDIYKVSAGELSNRWHNISGNVHFDIRFNRVSNLAFTFYPQGYKEVDYKTTKDGNGYIIHYDEDED